MLFLQGLFSAPDNEILPDYVFQRWHIRELDSLPPIDHNLIRSATENTCRNKTCAQDSLVADMLWKLDNEIFLTIAEASRYRILNHQSEDDDCVWAEYITILIKKVSNANRVRDCRPIAILSALLKL